MHSILRWGLTLLFGVAVASAPNTPLNSTTTIQDAVIHGEQNIEYTAPLPDWTANLRHYKELQKLEECESGGQAMKTLDTNGKYSYYYLQFQMATFVKYGLKYGIIKGTDDFTESIKSREIQFKIADKMVSNGLWSAWFNCWNIQGLPK